MDEVLHLNRNSGYYEATFAIKVNAEIFQHTFFRYVEENHVDITNPEAMQEAIRQVAKIAKWIDHPRTLKVPVSPSSEEQKETTPTIPVVTHKVLVQPRPVSDLPRKKPHSRLSAVQEEALIKRAMALPEERWIPDALTPIPEGLPRGRNHMRRAVHNLRYAERYALEQLKGKLEPAKEDVLEAVAGAVNGNRFN
jgi:hypothetical protein